MSSIYAHDTSHGIYNIPVLLPPAPLQYKNNKHAHPSALNASFSEASREFPDYWPFQSDGSIFTPYCYAQFGDTSSFPHIDLFFALPHFASSSDLKISYNSSSCRLRLHFRKFTMGVASLFSIVTHLCASVENVSTLIEEDKELLDLFSTWRQNDGTLGIQKCLRLRLFKLFPVYWMMAFTDAGSIPMPQSGINELTNSCQLINLTRDRDMVATQSCKLYQQKMQEARSNMLGPTFGSSAFGPLISADSIEELLSIINSIDFENVCAIGLVAHGDEKRSGMFYKQEEEKEWVESEEKMELGSFLVISVYEARQILKLISHRAGIGMHIHVVFAMCHGAKFWKEICDDWDPPINVTLSGMKHKTIVNDPSALLSLISRFEHGDLSVVEHVCAARFSKQPDNFYSLLAHVVRRGEQGTKPSLWSLYKGDKFQLQFRMASAYCISSKDRYDEWVNYAKRENLLLIHPNCCTARLRDYTFYIDKFNNGQYFSLLRPDTLQSPISVSSSSSSSGLNVSYRPERDQLFSDEEASKDSSNKSSLNQTKKKQKRGKKLKSNLQFISYGHRLRNARNQQKAKRKAKA
jgi:hypothetical protein